MVDLISLWLPILISAGLVFFASFAMWMVLPHHRSDWGPVPKEDETIQALRDLGVTEGMYSIPHCGSPEMMKDPAWLKKAQDGPSGMLIVRPAGPMKMGRAMLVSLIYNVVIGVFVAYLASRTIPQGAKFTDVFRIVGVGALLGYAGAWPTLANWFNHSWSSTWKHIFDALVYALLTAAVFGFLWP